MIRDKAAVNASERASRRATRLGARARSRSAGAGAGIGSPRQSRPRAVEAARPLLFLSHAGDDSGAVRKLADRLRRAGLDVWLDVEELNPADRWMKSLEEALARADAFAVYVGKSGIRGWVDREVRVALDRNTEDPSFRVIPILGAGSDVESLPFFLAQHQWLDLRDGFGEPAELKRLVGAILERAPETISLISPDEPPFRGLLPFDVEHAHLFFGRDRETELLLEQLHSDRFLAVVGNSGSGKSSLVRAGLVPALNRGRYHHDGGWVDSWRIAIFRPGDDPFREFANALCRLDDSLDAAERIAVRTACTQPLQHGTQGLTDCIAGLVPSGARTLLVVDQFEELFTLTPQPEERRRFIDSLLQAADTSGDHPVHCLITLRADFFAECWQHPELPKRISANQFAVRRADRSQLQEMIEKPAAMAGVWLEPGLAEAMLSDAGDEPGNLALLQHALLELWERRDGKHLTHAAYEAIGRLQGALEHRVEEIYQELDAEGREVARRVFLRLTEAGKGGEATRRPVRWDRLQTMGASAAAIETRLRRLVDQRLLTVSSNAQGHDQVEVAHEALIRGWDRLQGWLEEDREFLLWRKRLQASLEARERSGRADGTLLRGGLLAEAQRWQAEREQDLDQEQRAFIAASTRKARRGRQLRVALAAAMAILALIAGLAAVEATRRKEQAETYLEKAELAVHTMLTEVGHEALADVPQMEGVRHELLEKARVFYEQFLEEEPTDPDLRLEAAVAHMRIGDVHRSLGRMGGAEHAYRQAIERFDALRHELPDRPEHRRRLADGYNWLGEVLRESDRLQEARELYDRALALQRELAGEFQDRPVYRQEMARSYYNRGLALRQSERPGDAEKDFLQAIKLLRELSEASPDQPDYRQELARSYKNLAAVLKDTGNPVKARVRGQQAITLYRQLTDQQPGHREYKLELARAYNNQGNLLSALGQLEEAMEVNRQAMELFRDLAAAIPDLRNELANSYNSRGGILHLSGHAAQAEDAFAQAAGIFEELIEQFPDRSEYRVRFGFALANLGSLRKAAGDRDGVALAANKLGALLPELAEPQRDRLSQVYVKLAE